MATNASHVDLHTHKPCFDRTLDAWVLSRYSDVAAALEDGRLSIAPSTPGASASSGVAPVSHDGPASRRPTTPPQIPVDRGAAIAASATRLTASLPANVPVDLVATFAAPWALDVAAAYCHLPHERSLELSRHAHLAFLAAAASATGAPTPAGLDAITAVANGLSAAACHASLGVQGFIALSQTLPHFVAAAWLALAQHPEQMHDLRSNAELMPRAVEELLRYAGPARAVFRQAHDPISIGNARIARGDRVVLLLAAANRDAARFANPDRLDLRRASRGHLAFGRGPHACVGAVLIRTAVAAATRALLDGSHDIELVGEPEWLDGYAIRAPSRLTVILRRSSE